MLSNFNMTGEIMAKRLSEMTLEKLWQLFPIVLTAHKDCWGKWYLEEETILKKSSSTTRKDKSYRKYGDFFHLGKAYY